MIYRPIDFEETVVRRLMGLATELEIGGLVLSPRVMKGRYIQYYIEEGWLLDEREEGQRLVEFAGSYKRQVKETTVPQPCSVDILLREFTDKDGRPLDFPFNIPPYDEVVGHSHLNYYEDSRLGAGLRRDYHIPGAIICVETRSSIARKGLACTGFHSSKEPTIFLRDWGRDLSFVLKNYSHNPLVITRPFSPVQISVTIDGRGTFGSPLPLRLLRNGQDVTEENLVRIGSFVAYKVHLANELVYLRRTDEPVDITSNDIGRMVERTDVAELYRYNPDFCLTLTEEDVHTNGCPAYIYPFHYLDAVENQHNLENTSLLGEFFQELFSNPRYLPVTANAGLINPGTHGKVVCENITRGRNLEKYFKPHEPFALVIPVPFYDGGTDTETYTGEHKNQQDITF